MHAELIMVQAEVQDTFSPPFHNSHQSAYHTSLVVKSLHLPQCSTRGNWNVKTPNKFCVQLVQEIINAKANISTSTDDIGFSELYPIIHFLVKTKGERRLRRDFEKKKKFYQLGCTFNILWTWNMNLIQEYIINSKFEHAKAANTLQLLLKQRRTVT